MKLHKRALVWSQGYGMGTYRASGYDVIPASKVLLKISTFLMAC